MFIQCHPDDSEIFMPGTFAMAGGDQGNKCYICCVGRIENVPSNLDRTKRMEAIKWFTSKYLVDYIWLNNSTPFAWDQIKSQLITIINAIRPDIIITYSPFGYSGHPEHRNTSAAISAIYNSLSYKPKIYWIINTGQDIVRQPMPEQLMYPPTDIINLNVYSSKLGKTYWDAKLEIWEQYSHSVPDLKTLLADTAFLQNNDKREYFRESGI
jgi:LmbE family N-acetylglucosaminyl deacetylase